ncbi:MAG TPA: PEP-CTERM sorting domain-containing protein, partial [Thermodesulfovibrionia bacterium]|nr:PEP-CTERM sorting domain-containing protein [Thermodesulfovibrionia bacterium]
FVCIGWCSIEPSFVSLLTYDPPVVGFSDNYHWSLDYYTSSWIKEEGAPNFGVKIMATAVPEPSTLLLLGSGLAGLAAIRRKFKI